MEIISCFESQRPQSRGPFKKITQKKRVSRENNSYRRYSYNNSFSSSDIPVFKSPSLVLSEIALGIKRFNSGFGGFVRNNISKSWVLAVVALFFAGLWYGTGLIERNTSFAHPVEFFETDEFDESRLEALMAEFAVKSDYGFDEFGNLINSEEISSASFKEPVVFENYTVKNGDTISGITYKFGLSNISTLIQVNGISNVRTLRAGQKLVIPSIDGIVYTAGSGETLGTIASKNNVSLADLVDVNDLDSELIAAGSKIFIPGGKLDALTLKKAMGEVFTCPISASYRLTSKFGRRNDPFTGVLSNHTGIDMACPTGTQIKASMSGTVSYAGWSNVYGYYVIINHADGYQTLYGHMSKIIAKKGDVVNQSTVIGLVGNTGYSTGSHLHFTVYKNGKLVDPLTLLK